MSDRVPVTVFLPVGMCSCSQTGFLSRINEILSKYKSIIDYRQDSAGSEEGVRFGIRYRGIKIGTQLLQSNPTVSEMENALIAEAKALHIMKEE